LPIKLSFSEHARVKLEQRNLSQTTLKQVLQRPQGRFYDTNSGAQIAVGAMQYQAVDTNLVVVFRRKDSDTYHIITAYPQMNVEDEIRRKVKVGRWIPTPTGAKP